MNAVEAALGGSRIVAVLRGLTPHQTVEVARALAAAGIRCIEVTMNSQDVFECISKIAQISGVIAGAGTVMTPDEVARAVDSGAEFIVSPHFSAEVVQATKRLGKASMPGAMTPTEAVVARNAGADIVKIFPASVAGYSFFREMKGPLPYIRLMATGGVSLENAVEYIRAGAYAVALGSALTPKDAVHSGNYSLIEQRARQLVEDLRLSQDCGTR